MEKEKLKRQNCIWSVFGYRNPGFTLVELVIVVSIISFLVLMGMALLRLQVFKGNDARRKSDIKKIQVAIEEYEKDNDCYPPSEIVVCEPGDSLRPYIDKIPCDPVSRESYYYEPKSGACPNWYILYSKLENEKDGDVIYGLGPGGAYNYVAGSPNAPLSTPGPTPTGGGGSESGYWGCKSGICAGIGSRTECSPNYTSSGCSGQCGTPENPMNECVPI
ncbi:MAG: Type II secretion system protein G [Candidatus Woesebacteria bacterium GW2011_GWB1_41_10]|uniref:Type II secretion system protein G n=1 Tax=Candidatus Woesebacteria bacterium GW2011_GWB1_41_10 TaxID=1618577 RepID=A0A0G0U7Z4_9BACT|nr:MAG: Type II secretion system protein G [Candidatus Woesebacteria bacterium GW2011_GWB1_41_10]